jgi:hypothetical protein
MKILKTVIVLAFLTGLGILGYSIASRWNDAKYGRYLEWYLADYLTALEYDNDKVGIRNDSTGKILGMYDHFILSDYNRENVSNRVNSTVFVVVKDNLRGYISGETGEALFEPQFLFAWMDDHETGLAACVNKDYKLGFVNVRTKEIAIPFNFDYNENLFAPHSDYGKQQILDFVFSNGICIVPGKDGRIGMIDKTGKTLLPTKYSDIINWRDAGTPNIILQRKPFVVDIGIVSEDCDGYVKVTEIIQDAPAFLQGELKENDIILKIKQENEEDYRDVSDMTYEDALDLIKGEKGTNVSLLVKHENGSTQDITIIRDEVEDSGSGYEYVYGVCDRNFKMIVPFEYNCFKKNAVYCFDEDKWTVKNYIVSKEGRYGILDTIFNTILPLKYNNIKAGENSYIVEMDGKYGILDSSLNTVLPLEYDWIGAYSGNKYIVRKDYAQKLYDEEGNLLSDFYIEKREEYDDSKDEYVEKSAFEPVCEPYQTILSGYIQYCLDGYYGIIDSTNRVVIPSKYNKIEYLGNGRFACTEGDYLSLLKDKNNY